MMNQMGRLMAIVPLYVVTMLGLLIYYIIHIVNNSRLEPIEKLVWVIIVLFTNIIGFIIYWYMQIWKAPSPATQS
ncbi:MAG: PLDc N-terminal domain-containing protein [Bacteroidetes bacterium]|nr:PLDc N-terminal domain-containing protein [Bacteroidota bacterium]